MWLFLELPLKLQYVECHYSDCCTTKHSYSYSCHFNVGMLSVIILIVIILNVANLAIAIIVTLC
jgi:hypothetical protein